MEGGGCPCNASCAATSEDMNNPLKGSHACDGALVEKLNIFSCLSNFTLFNGNLKISYNSNLFF